MKTKNILIALLCVASVAIEVSAQVKLLKDINTTGGTSSSTTVPSSGSSPENLVAVGNTLFFVATTDLGKELWKSDGTISGTRLVKDINIGSVGSNPGNLTDVNGILYFTANDGVHGTEIWKSDGTSSGTVLVKDIQLDGGSVSGNLTNVNGVLYFTGFTSTNGSELWKSDGTEEGTQLVKDIFPGSESSFPSYFVNINGTLFFSATDPLGGNELWKSDGSGSGTVVVKDIQVGGGWGEPRSLTNINGELYFAANDGVSGFELWRSNGSESGTYLVKDISAGPSFGNPTNFTKVGSWIYFSADNGTNGQEVWKSDGTSGGTMLLKDVYPGANGSFPSLINFNGTLCFSAFDGTTLQLWKSNGTGNGTTVIDPNLTNLYNFLNINNIIYVFTNNGQELWTTDGNSSGTFKLKDIAVLTGGSSAPRFMANVNGTLYFSINDIEYGKELWKSDGTSYGTKIVKDIVITNASAVTNFFTKFGNKNFFFADDGIHGKELWISDGTSLGTYLLKDINSGIGSNSGKSLTAVNETFYFSAVDGMNGTELWKTDGTTLGTVIVKDINPGLTSSGPIPFTDINGILYFTANGVGTGSELWKSDGTESGTILVKDINNGSASSSISNAIKIGQTLYFAATNGINGKELWKSDGTLSGTILVKDILSGSGNSNPSNLTNVGDILFFTANNTTNGIELWKSDGTTAGTQIVQDIFPGSVASNPSSLREVNGILYFIANDGINGQEVWRSDGTSSGTQIVKDIRTGGGNSSPLSLANMNGVLYFVASDGIHGQEVWKSDGTTSGTQMVKDIFPDNGSSVIGSGNLFTYFNGNVYFAASDGANGKELWKTDGTPAGTTMVKDIFPGIGSGTPNQLTIIDNSLYFIGSSYEGKGLWKSSNGSSCETIALPIENSLTDLYDIYSLDNKVLIAAADNIHGQELFVYGIESDPTNPCLLDPVPTSTSTKALYNGLIASVRWRTDAAYSSGKSEFTGMYSFSYDEKYQLKEANWVNPLNLAATTNKFRVTGLSYDPNGNILALRRYSKYGYLDNNFEYKYNSDPIKAKTNQLENIPGHSSYKYNTLGQMTEEDKETGPDQYVEYDVTGKVRKVYSSKHPTTGAFENLKVEFIYDDRGFRLAKKNFESNKTTWYIRDASGNIQSVFEEDIITHSLTQTEIPVYGSGKLATVYPEQHYSTAYELTDHLGNVRALMKEHAMEFTATIEDNGAVDYNNPRVREMAVFQNLFETELEDARFNHTPGGEYSAYLHWINGMGTLSRSVGPSTFLKVNAGDTISLETWVRFENKSSYLCDMPVATFSQFLGNAFAFQGAFEGMNPAQTANTFATLLHSIGNDNNGLEDLRPIAFLNYMLFDENSGFVDGGWEQVPYDAGFNPGEEALPNRHKKISIGPIVVPEKGYIYVWVTNEAEDSKVWFDDLKIRRVTAYVSQATDYGVWGDVLREQKTNEDDKYRWYYQGQYAERDLETGWNHFELREFDPIVGRWTSTDPAGQYWSPYLGMSNNPISGVDPDGAYSQIGAWWRSGFGLLGEMIQDDEGTWGYNTTRASADRLTTVVIPHYGDEKSTMYELLGIGGNNGPLFTEYDIPGWGASKRAGDAAEAGNYFYVVGWMALGIADMLSLGEFGLGRSVVAKGGGSFYRAMSNAEFAALESSGGLSHMAGKELFVSSSANYSRAYLQKSGYDVLVKFNMKPGAMNYFNQVGVMHRTAAGASGWAGRGSLLWKSEQGVMNLGIQSNTGMFNPWINSFKVIK